MNNNILIKDKYYMQHAINESVKAYLSNEIPIGAIAVYENKIIAKTYNKIEKYKSVTGHAEILLINKVSKYINDWRLNDVTFYITKNPCIMCLGAMINARIKRLVFGINYINSNKILINLMNIASINILITSNVMEKECLKIFHQFFQKIRINHKYLQKL